MSAVEETKPVATETPEVAAPLELTPAAEPAKETPAAAATAETTETPAVAATEATPEATTETPAPAAEVAEDKKEEETKKVEPIYSGALGYKVHHAGFDIKSIISGPKKRYFWFGEDAPISTQNLNNYLRGEKPKVAHPVAAWSSKTGKGLLYFVKHADEKTSPAGVLPLADVTDVVEAAGLPEFSFKLDGSKHTFETKTKEEASGWVLALKEKIEEAKSIKEEVQSSTEYKDTSAHLNKPVTAGLAAAGAAGTAVAKEEKKEEAEEPTTDKVEEKKETKKSKSRSVSRGNKRQSIFGNILGKKEESEPKKEEKTETKEETEAPAVVAAEAPVAAAEPTTEEAAAPAAETTEAAPVEAAAPTEEVKPAEEATPAPTKANKRGSIFGTFFEKVRSPTHEKKEAEVTPTVPPKDEAKDKELPAAPETETTETAEPTTTEAAAPAIAEPVVTEAPAEEAKVEEKPAPQTERKGSFFGKLKTDFQKLRSPSSERTPVVASETNEEPKEETAVAEAPATTETIEAAPVTEAKPEEAAAAVEEPKADVNGTEKKEGTPEKRRTSFFGSVKKDKAEGGESTGQKLGGLFRNPSKLIKGNKEGKKAAAPAKVEEEQTKVSDEAPKLDEPKKEAPLDAKPEEAEATQSIGDVVPAAVQVGQPQTVSATA